MQFFEELPFVEALPSFKVLRPFVLLRPVEMLLFLERFDPFKSTVPSGVLEWLGMSRSADLFSQTEGHDVLDSSLEADSSVNGEKSFLEQIIIVRTKGQSYSWHFISSHTSLYDQPDL